MKTDRKAQLTREAATRRANLENLKRDLAGATSRFKHTRHEATDGKAVADLAGRIRLAEIALDGVLEELANVDRPRPVAITAPIEELVKQRAYIVQRRDYRHKEHQERVRRERERCGYPDATHVAQHIANVFGPTQAMRRRDDEADERILANIDAQLARLGYQPPTSPEAA